MSANLSMHGVERLRMALLQDAIDKYIQALHYLESHTRGVGSKMKQNRYFQAENTKSECENFFLSTWFEELYNIDPVYLIEQLRRLDHSKKIIWQKGPYTHRNESELFDNL